MTLGALLFDVDGTLADTEPEGHLPAYNRAFREHGLDWTWTKKLYRKLLLISGGRERIDHYLDRYDPELGPHDERVRDDRAGWIDEIHRSKSRYFRDRLQDGQVPLRAGVARLIQEAGEAGMRIAIVTNATRATLEPFLAYALGDALLAHIELTVCGDEVAHKKPAPDLYRMACERLGCAPESCIAIEDSNAGVTAAHAARVPALVTVNDDTRDQAFEHAIAVLDSLGEPDKPVGIIKSPGFDFDYVDLDVLRRTSAAALAHTRGAG
ncbi:HAD-IA family hydrolase [Endozoicomonas sp. G2_2]|uniref:HAD-IA family hydrolase n=1 Tax=Endozoicomonas sp. G2_2 TaxID=2821092 RepID=UPI001ADCB779|nr:HAD-IA family hydrolase [Endozoicomonas sp. G2_2]